MAITGVFNADFAPFSSAVDGAVLKLRDIEAGSEKVGTSFNRIGNSFSGAKVIQEATLLAKVFEQAGGAAAFTEKELARMAGTGAEAAAKLRALGQDVPPGIQKIADEARGASTSFDTLKGTVRGLATDFLAMFSARAAFNFVKDTINEASALKDLSQQTHINVEELQLLAGGMSEFGVDADTLGKGLFTLSRKIAGGDESVATGLHLMGMSLKDVEGLNGKELFLKIESGLATLQGGLRDTAAAQLFGGRLGAAMAGASEGIHGALESWERLNTVASTESVDAMDTFGESIDRANKNLSSIAANMIGPVAEGFNVLYAAATNGASKWAIAKATLLDYLDTQAIGIPQTGHLTLLLDEQNQKTLAAAAAAKVAAAGHTEVAAAVDKRTAAERFMAALETDAAKGITASQVAQLAHLKEIGALTAANAAGIGVNAAQFDKYKASIEAATKAAAELKKTREEAAKLEAASLLQLTKLEEQYTLTHVKQTGTATDAEVAGIRARYAVLEAEQRKAGTLTAQISRQMGKDMAQDLAGVGSSWTTLSGLSREAMEQLANAALKDYNRMLDSGLTFSRDVLDAQLKKYRDLRDAARGFGDAAVTAANKAKAATVDLSDKVHTLAGEYISLAEAEKRRASGGSFSLRDLTATQFAQAGGANKIQQIESGYLSNPGRQEGVNGSTGLLPNDAQGWVALLGERVLYAELKKYVASMPHLADGTSNWGGGMAIVGEHGPEMVRLPQGSSVTPSGQSGGGNVIYNTFNIVDTEANIARRVSDLVMRSVLQGVKVGAP